jgi:ribosomal protein S20
MPLLTLILPQININYQQFSPYKHNTITLYIHFYFLLHVSVIRVAHQQLEKSVTEGKVLQKRISLHNQSVKNAIDIIPKRGVIKGNNKTRKSIKFSTKFELKSQMS